MQLGETFIEKILERLRGDIFAVNTTHTIHVVCWFLSELDGNREELEALAGKLRKIAATPHAKSHNTSPLRNTAEALQRRASAPRTAEEHQ